MMRHYGDVAFIATIVLCLVLAAGAIFSSIETRYAAFAGLGGRKIDLAKVRKQISEGTLSGKKALFFRKVGEGQ
jgi:hypothetical protein